ncbi:MAG: hypothetical protein FD163_2539 [Hyphomonadaceae bacterium]|nr:MAG: hypothetical protein FD128_734 [Hyphomonadaceae bacterium]KAF0182674.1 MAG: hypothetical protein FD163_2539 [Hyphomonadaceae bacterium]
METKILGVSKKDQSVKVRFTLGGISTTRFMNAVFVDGKMDKPATEARIEELARGIAKKIERGVAL